MTKGEPFDWCVVHNAGPSPWVYETNECTMKFEPIGPTWRDPCRFETQLRVKASDPEFLTGDEVAAMFKISKTALQVQRKSQKFPGVLGVKVGIRLLFRRSDLDRWIEEEVAKQTKGTTFGFWQEKIREAKSNGS